MGLVAIQDSLAPEKHTFRNSIPNLTVNTRESDQQPLIQATDWLNFN